MTAALFLIAAGAGAVARYRVHLAGFGWVGTLALNVVGAFALGVLVALGPGDHTVTIVGTGLLGSLTTFSSFALEATEGRIAQRVGVIVGTLVLGISAAALGFAIG